MCYTRKDRGLNEEIRRPKAGEDWREKAESETGAANRERNEKLAEKAKEIVGAR